MDQMPRNTKGIPDRLYPGKYTYGITIPIESSLFKYLKNQKICSYYSYQYAYQGDPDRSFILISDIIKGYHNKKFMLKYHPGDISQACVAILSEYLDDVSYRRFNKIRKQIF